MTEGWIVGLGEVLWDVFRDGPRFGGAPANFACHARALGADVAMVSAVGPDSDSLSGHAVKILQQRGIDIRCLQSNAHETGRVIVDVDSAGKPTYTFSEHPAWDFIQWNDELARLAQSTRAVCYGTLAQRAPQSRETILRFLAECPGQTLRVFDVNLRVHYWSDTCIKQSLKYADILKLNDDELATVALAAGIEPSAMSPEDELRILTSLLSEYRLKLVALTRGAEGATLVSPEAIDHCPAPTVAVRDTVGAGDAYTAAMVIGLMKGWSLPKVNQQAVRLAAYVCSQSGATPELPPDVTRPFFEP